MIRVRLLLAVASALVIAAPALAQPAVAFDDAGLHAVHFVDASEGWACGDDGAIWHTMDGGNKWERQKTGTRASLRGIHFVNLSTGWAVGRLDTPIGSIGVMLKTTDSGNKWAEVGTNVMPGLHAVRFLDEKNGFACGDGSDAFPTGMFTTNDAGISWEPVKGSRLPSARGADVAMPAKDIVVAGAWGKLGAVNGGTYREAELDPLGGRNIHSVACVTEAGKVSTAFAACDGGAVLTSTDGGRKWGFVNLGLPAAALASCDFRCVATFGTHVWVAGRPGGFVLHSADLGKTWDVQKTELSVPVNGMHFVSEKEGWLVGDLGCIIGTVDGGKSWKVQRAGGQRAAALFLHSSGKNTPLDVVAGIGAADGYLCASTSLMNADPATADPKRASDGLRARAAMRLAGGSAAESAWAFPLSAHATGLPPRELLATWDRAHNGKANEQLLRHAVLAIRTWQPDVIVCDLYATDTNPADALALNVAKEAFKQAADANCFPEQITALGLKPWEAKKLYALALDPKTAAVKLDQGAFSSRLNDSPKDFAETATRVLAGDGAVVDRRCFVLVAHRLQGAEGHANLMDGVALAPGGTARRNVSVTYDPATAAEKQKAVQSRRNIELLANINDSDFGGVDKLMGSLNTELKKMPDDVAARTAFAVGTRLAREGKWIEAREVFGVLTINYPGHPLAVEGFRWLTRYHASTEARRRTEIQQKMLLKTVTFEAKGGGNIKPASGTATTVGGANVEEDHYKFYSPNMILKWHQTCLDLEPKLDAFGPVYSRDPASWLCFLAARKQVGRHTDADTFISDYFKHTPAAVTGAPGLDLWRDCLAAELWLVNPTAIATPPKALVQCRLSETRPILDGKLDDDCWKAAKVMKLNAAATPDKPEEAKAFGERYRTESVFTYDDRYLYIGVKCSHPVGKKVEPVTKRTRDADLNGHDRVDILLDMDRDYQTYYRFQIDHRGCLAEDCWGDKTWNPKYHAAFQATDDGWTAELAIPLAELTGEKPSHGKTWAMNVSRFVPGAGVQSWSGPTDNDPRPEGMGLLQFRSDK
ncbi:photosystem ii stability assembly factor : Uncharacterized photosystem II stability/assembly factor-like protein OS=Pirellula staleyi (strain ATCC 27377 / DSM 6068 / ICPB 4128) GN=Psta_0929 PE=4 SV=1: PSII_BNR: DUF1083 [Gemmata massiliana]|uniref:Photosynthesis system II assembly factor Ycf48/Hcf136-like domain-containing protein n=1 Tax=Gemmata massiliana TaxID=1210884 RepID=A0A6P2CRW0_9BACT|nr:sugar-binding protein [Gemmata massiliana]VTR91327.1 photosystem ii stability assembly factor : Uncharacterized photosystem II stability/assembly factor-like protein OS=Pirellula staleyi (strain ATCC 27377 / DSM 6068 / ICPB 4128) GN=Psta_0929 PE=4 SV=1: PSII_BNR: DUF1083 [Gemmata massiliana]